MAAVVKIYELTGQNSGVDKTSSVVRFKLADNTNVDNSDPITIPSSGYTNSFTKQLRLYVATAPSQVINNFKMYSDGSNNFGTGVSVNATNAATTFTANATSLMSGSDLFSYTSGAPLALNVSATNQTGTGMAGDICKLQLRVASTANPGALSSEQIVFSYDEI